MRVKGRDIGWLIGMIIAQILIAFYSMHLLICFVLGMSVSWMGYDLGKWMERK